MPHAGWSYSGRLAAMTFRAVMEREEPVATLVIFGADHTGAVGAGEVYDAGCWETPLGPLEVDETLAAELIDASPLLRGNPDAHDGEHSIEVQLPLIQAVDPAVRIVPIGMPPDPVAVEAGRVIGDVLNTAGRNDVCIIGSSDLTHHGGHFGSPGGSGEQSEAFATENDERILALVKELKAEEIIPEVRKSRNACGAGAIAATLAAVRAMGATAGRLLEYTNSYRLTRENYPWVLDDTTVGYASVVFA